MKIIKGIYDHNLRFRQHLGKGTFGEIPFEFSVNIDGKAIFVELDQCPTIMFNLEELVEHAYSLLGEDGYVRDGRLTGKEYRRQDYMQNSRGDRQ